MPLNVSAVAPGGVGRVSRSNALHATSESAPQELVARVASCFVHRGWRAFTGSTCRESDETRLTRTCLACFGPLNAMPSEEKEEDPAKNGVVTAPWEMSDERAVTVAQFQGRAFLYASGNV